MKIHRDYCELFIVIAMVLYFKWTFNQVQFSLSISVERPVGDLTRDINISFCAMTSSLLLKRIFVKGWKFIFLFKIFSFKIFVTKVILYAQKLQKFKKKKIVKF